MNPESQLTSRSQLALQEFEQVLRKASEKKTSDLHLKAGLPPIVRVNGFLYYLSDDSADSVARLTTEQILRWVHALTSVRQRERFENGEEVDLGFELPGVGRYRINLCQQRGNPRLVCRYIPDQIRTLQEIGMPADVIDLTQASRGLVLVTGATGSGKSTTLAAMIDQIARTRSCHIVTIEDPIEFTFKDRKSIITQREVGLDTKNFSQALKYALRQDPDVILVGEMRDEETITMALNAAETGHLVFSTLHTTDSAETINRILGSVTSGLQGSVRHQLASVIVGVVSQRLLRRKDGKGRIAAVEVMKNNARIKDMILDPLRTNDIPRAIEESFGSGMQSFDQSLVTLLQRGLITPEEALANCSNARDFKMRMQGVTPGEWREGEGQERAEPSVRKAEIPQTGDIVIEGINGTKGDALSSKNGVHLRRRVFPKK